MITVNEAKEVTGGWTANVEYINSQVVRETDERRHVCILDGRAKAKIRAAAIRLKCFQFHTYGVLSLTQEGRTVVQGPEAVVSSVGTLHWLRESCETFRRISRRAGGRVKHRLWGNELDIGRQLERLRLLQDELFGVVADACEPCSFQLIAGRGERGARFKASVARLRWHRRASIEGLPLNINIA